MAMVFAAAVMGQVRSVCLFFVCFAGVGVMEGGIPSLESFVVRILNNS